MLQSASSRWSPRSSCRATAAQRLLATRTSHVSTTSLMLSSVSPQNTAGQACTANMWAEGLPDELLLNNLE